MKSAPVTNNGANGQIIMASDTLPAQSSVSFALTNSTIVATDPMLLSIAGGATPGAYLASVDVVAAGSYVISLRKLTSRPLSEAVTLNYDRL